MYKVLYADPPWFYRHRVTGRNGRGAAEHHYKTMKVEEIKAFPLPPLDKNCYLFLWCTNPLMAEGTHAEICRAWGFKPQSILTWRKPVGFGMGYTLRSATEHILVGRKGKPQPKNRSTKTWFDHKALGHSVKPEKARFIIESLAEGPYVELFARRPFDGWDCFGDVLEDGKEPVPGCVCDECVRKDKK